MSQLRVEDLLPDPVFFPRHERIHVPWPYPSPVTSLPKRVRFNPLAVLLRIDELPLPLSEADGSGEISDEENEESESSSDSPHAKFALHISFGNEDLQSQVRVEFTV